MARQSDTDPSSPTYSLPSPQTLPYLPPEIWEQIWLLTFLPRRVMLHRRFQRCSEGDGQSTTFETMFGLDASFSFTATILDPSDRLKFFSDSYEWDALHPPNKAPPPGPIALRVCHQSRAIALSRYQLAFGAVDMNRRDRSSLTLGGLDHGPSYEFVVVGEPRIWIDFKRDEILNDSSACGGMRYNPIATLTFCAKEEVKKIRRLSLGGRWAAMVKPSHPRRFCSLFRGLQSFEALEELIIYDGSLILKPKAPESLQEWKEKMQTDIRKELQRVRSSTAAWTAELPLIKIFCDF